MRIRDVVVGSVLGLSACAGKLSSDDEAAYAYVGLDGAVSRALALGLTGFNQADSANIATQTGDGDVSGTMTVDGQVDRGASDNKGLRLDVALDEYADVEDLEDDEKDEIVITYFTDPDATLPYFDLSLRNMPDGTLSGTLTGTFFMKGDLEDEVELNLQIDGAIEADPEVTDGVRRAEGSTTVTGTATTGRGGTFDVDVEI